MNRARHPLLLIALTFFLAACGPDEDEGVLDPSEFVDENAVSDDLGIQESELGRPTLRTPFRCGQVWTATTWSGHSPRLAVDWNRPYDYGDAVLASAGGTVSRSESEGNVSYGNWIEINHGNGWRTRYAHLSVRGVRVGARVSMGQKIGEVGNSGGSSSSHLHYEQRYNGSPVRVRLGSSTWVYYYGRTNYRSGNGC